MSEASFHKRLEILKKKKKKAKKDEKPYQQELFKTQLYQMPLGGGWGDACTKK